MDNPLHTTPLTHADERLGNVAIDMGIMTSEQVDDCRVELVKRRMDVGRAFFGEVAIASGAISEADFRRVEAEELRRRRLIGGYEIIDLVGSGTIATV